MVKSPAFNLPNLLDRANISIWKPETDTGKRRARAAEKHRLEQSGWLRKKWRSNTLAMALADKLDACGTRHPCGSGACPSCGQAAQNQVVTTFREFLKQNARGKTVAVIGIALPSATVSVGGLAAFDTINFVRRLQYVLDGAGVSWLIGCLDYSLNEHETARYKPHWLPHLHAFTVIEDPIALSRALTARISATDAVPRPVRVEVWDGKSKGLRYAWKTKFERRIGVDNATRHDPKSGNLRTCRATKSQRLHSAERLELLLHLDAIGIDSRFITRKSQLRSGLLGPFIMLLSGGHRKPKIRRNGK